MAMRSGAEFGRRALVGWIHSYGMLHSTPLDLYRLVPDGYGFLFTTLGKKDQSAAETKIALCSPYRARNEKLIAFLEASGFTVAGSYGMTEELTRIRGRTQGRAPPTWPAAGSRRT